MENKNIVIISLNHSRCCFIGLFIYMLFFLAIVENLVEHHLLFFRNMSGSVSRDAEALKSADSSTRRSGGRITFPFMIGNVVFMFSLLHNYIKPQKKKRVHVY